MDLAYPSVLKRCHRIWKADGQEERIGLPGGVSKNRLPDPEIEADEMYQNAWENPISNGIRMILPAGEPINLEDAALARATDLRS